MKKKKRGKREFRLKHFIFLLIVFWVGKTLISQSIVMNDLSEEKLRKEQEVVELQGKIEQLQMEIKNKDSLTFVEKVAREKLGLVKPREIIYIDKNSSNGVFKNCNN
ncbi:FtsB family cell division protein [Schnuerera sp. xch1]|uniref:FtsB family cell division protein n=1 Tax=Schnuerera sp. xch1 TaxID=2874283 RepID=UPI001CBFA229|nr:septum formation initiator family protein [Schnuerera sp. xch1]